MAVSVHLRKHVLAVSLTGADAALALKAGLEIPVRQISRIVAMDQREVPYTPSTWLRAPGGYFPGLFRHGSYGWKPNREFWAVFRKTRVLVIDVQNWDYHRVVLGVDHADGVANDLSDAVNRPT